MNTKQSIFDTACAAIIAQGKPSLMIKPGGGHSCRYRGPDGTKCAIGFLLSDGQIENYRVMENDTPSQFPEALLDQLITEGGIQERIAFLSDLQDCHDQAARCSDFVAAFKKNANAFAKNYNLTPIKETES